MRTANIFGRFINSVLVGGSTSQTSSAAPAILFSVNAVNNDFRLYFSPGCIDKRK